MRIPIRAAILGGISAVCAGIGGVSADCPDKISPKLCPALEAARDSAYLNVRIVLDAKVENGFVWDKNKPAQERPLKTVSESLIVAYHLRQIGAPDSAYVRRYLSTDPSPDISSVLYHNAAVTKADLGKLAAESYVAAVEPGCRRLSDRLCSDINTRPDTASLYITIGFSAALQADSSARAAFLAKYAVRDSLIDSAGCHGEGFAATPAAIRAMGMEEATYNLERGSVGCILPIRPGPAARAAVPKRMSDAYRNRRMDGRLRRALPRG